MTYQAFDYSKVKSAVFAYIQAQGQAVPTWKLQFDVGRQFGLDMSHDEKYGPSPSVRRMEGQISRAATALADQRAIVRTIERTGRGKSTSAYYRSLGLADADQAAEERAAAERKASLRDFHVEVTDRSRYPGRVLFTDVRAVSHEEAMKLAFRTADEWARP